MDADHESPGLYEEVVKRPADLLIHCISADFDHTVVIIPKLNLMPPWMLVQLSCL